MLVGLLAILLKLDSYCMFDRALCYCLSLWFGVNIGSLVVKEAF